MTDAFHGLTDLPSLPILVYCGIYSTHHTHTHTALLPGVWFPPPAMQQRGLHARASCSMPWRDAPAHGLPHRSPVCHSYFFSCWLFCAASYTKQTPHTRCWCDNATHLPKTAVWPAAARLRAAGDDDYGKACLGRTWTFGRAGSPVRITTRRLQQQTPLAFTHLRTLHRAADTHAPPYLPTRAFHVPYLVAPACLPRRTVRTWHASSHPTTHHMPSLYHSPPAAAGTFTCAAALPAAPARRYAAYTCGAAPARGHGFPHLLYAYLSVTAVPLPPCCLYRTFRRGYTCTGWIATAPHNRVIRTPAAILPLPWCRHHTARTLYHHAHLPPVSHWFRFIPLRATTLPFFACSTWVSVPTLRSPYGCYFRLRRLHRFRGTTPAGRRRSLTHPTPQPPHHPPPHALPTPPFTATPLRVCVPCLHAVYTSGTPPPICLATRGSSGTTGQGVRMHGAHTLQTLPAYTLTFGRGTTCTMATPHLPRHTTTCYYRARAPYLYPRDHTAHHTTTRRLHLRARAYPPPLPPP